MFGYTSAITASLNLDPAFANFPALFPHVKSKLLPEDWLTSEDIGAGHGFHRQVIWIMKMTPSFLTT